MSFYKEFLMEHFKNPKNFYIIENATFQAGSVNPSCGDFVYIYINLQNDIITEIAHQAKGCVICVATTSLLTEYLKNKNLNIIKNLNSTDILDLIKLELGPNRLRCAMLCLESCKSIYNARFK